jgi:4-hydroxybenzoate polyprenyltransferase
MPLEAGLLGYAAWTSLALASKRGLPSLPVSLSPHTGRFVGYALLALSAISAVLRFGPPIGVVAWLAQLCVAGALVIVILSWRPKLALALGVPALAAGALLLALAGLSPR